MVSSGRLGLDLGRLEGVSGHLAASWSVLGRPHGVLGPSWGMLEASWGVLGRLGGASLGVLEVSWGVLSLEPFSACPGTVSETSWH